jgi:hypothetical protein
MFRFRRASVLPRTHVKATDNIFTRVPYRKCRHGVGPMLSNAAMTAYQVGGFCA